MNLIAAPGAVIFVNRRDRMLVPGGDFVVRADAGATFKRFRSSPQRFEPVSSDPSHEAMFPEGQVKVIGRVRRIQLDL